MKRLKMPDWYVRLTDKRKKNSANRKEAYAILEELKEFEPQFKLI